MVQPSSPKFALTLLDENQDNAEVTINTFTDLMEAFVGGGLVIEEFGLNTPPGSPNDGEAWVIGSSPTGAWASNADEIAIYLSGWNFFDPSSTGLDIAVQAFDRDAQEMIAFSPVEDEWYPVQDRWSTTEHWTGKYMETEKIYAKCVDFGALPDAPPGSKTVAHGISNLDTSRTIIAQVSGELNSSTITVHIPVVFVVGGVIDYSMDGTNLNIGTNFNAGTMGYDANLIRIEYCKT